MAQRRQNRSHSSQRSQRDLKARRLQARQRQARGISFYSHLGFEALELRRLLTAATLPALTPAEVDDAYGINQIEFDATPGDGRGETIAIIDPGNDGALVPSSSANFSTSDLGVFDSMYKLANPTSSNWFSIVGQNGLAPATYTAISSISVNGAGLVTVNHPTATLSASSVTIAEVTPQFVGGKSETYDGVFSSSSPADFTIVSPTQFTYVDTAAEGLSAVSNAGTINNPVDTGESTLDVEWAHAIAPMANIVLIEVNSFSDTDIAAATTTAANLGAQVVSMSFMEGDEFYSDTDFSNTSTAYIASSGDNSGTGSPATSPDVLAVGGTNLALNGNSYGSEGGWSTLPIITQASETGTQVTITTSAQTGYVVGGQVTISGLGPNYDGLQTITGVTTSPTDTFTFTAASGLSTLTPLSVQSATFSVVGGTDTATITTGASTPLTTADVGDTVSIANVGSGYNGNQVITSVNTVTNSFTFTVGSALSNFGAGGTVSGLVFGSIIPGLHNSGGSGGGVSAENQPSYQHSTEPAQTKRTSPDVSFVGGSETPVSTYSSEDGGWLWTDGTSVSAPAWAGLVAIADQGLTQRLGHAASLSTVGSVYQLQTALYNLAGTTPADFHDVTTGNNGNPAGTGYDLVTGLGTPVANGLIPDLAGFTDIDYSVPTTGGPHQLLLEKVNTNLVLYDNGVQVASEPLATVSNVSITDGNSTDDTLTVDYQFQGEFTANIQFDHTVTAGYDTLTVNAPNGPTNTVTLTENAANSASTITLNGAAWANSPQTISFQNAAEVDLNAGSGGDAMTLAGNGDTSGLQRIYVKGGVGNDTLSVDSSAGLMSAPNGIEFDGGAGLNTLHLTQTGGTSWFSDTYSVGPNPGQGTDVIVPTSSATTGLQTINFLNLTPVIDTVPAATATVTATPASNAINYTLGPNSGTAGVGGATTGQVTVDNQESYEFANKTTLVINAEAGNDAIDLDYQNSSAPTGLTTINVNGNDPTGPLSDVLTVNGISGVADTITDAPDGTGAGQITDPAAGFVTVNYTGLEGLNIVGQTGDADSLVILNSGNPGTVEYAPGATPDAGTITGTMAVLLGGFDYVPITFTGISSSVNLVSGPGAATVAVLIDGTANDDTFTFNATATPTIVVDGHTPVTFQDSTFTTQITLRGLGGNDTLNYLGSSAETALYAAIPVLFQGGDSGADPDVVNYTPIINATTITVGLASAGNAQTIAATGSNTVSFTGAEIANILAPATSTSALTVNGTGNDDALNYTPSGASSGSFQLAYAATQFNFSNIGGTFTFAESAGIANGLVINGTSGQDTFDLDAVARTASLTPASAGLWKPVVLGASVQDLTAEGYSGKDTFRVTPAAGVVANATSLNNLVINVDGAGGGSVPADNALVIWNEGATLPSTNFVVVNKTTATSGVVRTFNSESQWPDINYSNVETITPDVFTAAGTPTINSNLLVMGPDTNDPDNTLATATYLGSGSTIQVQNGTIFPGGSEYPSTPQDVDFYRVVAQVTGTLDFQVYFNLYAGLLPGNGQLTAEAFDSAGNLIANATTGIYGALGNSGNSVTTQQTNARVRIPVVAGQSYYVEVLGVHTGEGPNTTINGYNMTIVNTAPPVPYNGELSRSVAPPDAGSPDTGDLPPTAAADDTGRSQFDNVTNINTPTVYFYLGDDVLLNDLPGNQTGNPPPAGVIPLNQVGVATNPAFQVAIFDGPSNAEAPVGFATNYDLFFGTTSYPGLYFYTFTNATKLADGFHQITAAVQMLDPATPQVTGFGSLSEALDITVDTVAPPVNFGNSTTGTIDGLTPDSDSGVTGQLLTFNDRITNVTQPTFYGVAEANAIIDVYAQESSSVQAGATPLTQLITINATGGSFTLSYQGGAQTAPLSFNTPAAAVQAAINTIFNFNSPSTNVTVTKSGDVYTVTFQSAPLSLLQIGGNPFSGGASTLNEPELLLGETTAVPDDGTNAFPGGAWTLTTTINLNDPRYFSHDGTRQLWVTATDLAGNVSSTSPANAGPGQTFLMDIDTQGPTVGGILSGTTVPSIQIAGSPNYNVFLEKTDGTPTPTPNVNQLVINIFDPSPHDTTDFPIPASGWALIDAIAQTPGAITVTGEANGIMPIQSVVVTNQSVTADGQIEATLLLTFQPLDSQAGNQAEFGLPDDRYTITINDSLVDIAGNALDGETNSPQPLASPKDPSGNGVPGSNFAANFTVDSHPEIATYSDGTVNIDLNGNGTFDPTNPDFTNRDASVSFGYGTDTLFAGNLYPAGSAPLSNFDKLGAYGYANGTFRWLINFAGNGSMDPSSTATYVQSGAYEINGTPVVINYAGRPMIGLFDGNGTWYFDYNGNDTIGPGDLVIHGDMVGQPVIGDFNGDGYDDLATYYQGVFYIDLAGPGGALTGNWNTEIAVNNTALISGTSARPVAADVNGDGVTDLGFYLPGRTTQPTGSESEWYFLVSDGAANGIGGLNHSFEQYPLGTDVFYNFGNNFALPLIGNFDPPAASGGTNNVIPSVQNVPAAGVITLSNTTNSALGVPDLGGANEETVSLSVTTGMLSLSKTTGLSFTSGTGKDNSSMTFSGSTFNVNQALNGLTYAAPNQPGSAVLTMTSGETGSGATETSTLTINVNGLVQQQGSTLNIKGSGGSDTVSVAFQDATHFTVVVDGQSTSYTTAGVNKVVFTGGTGHETVSFTDAVAADVDTATLQMGAAKITRAGFEFDATAAQSITVNGNTKSIANLLDAAGGRFIATVTNSYLTGNGLLSQALGFGTVTAHSAAPPPDSATFYAGTNSSIIASPSSTQMKGNGYLITAYGFPTTYAYSDSAGTAVASLTANPHSTFIGMATSAIMEGAGFFNEVYNFKTINAVGNATSTALLYDTAGNDTFTANQNTATMRTATGVATSAVSFGAVSIYSTTGHDTDHATALDFVFKKYGHWIDV